MKTSRLFAIILLLGFPSVSFGQTKAWFTESDWPWWRGPDCNGIAADQEPPLRWSDEKNILWRTAIPGRGHGSPMVFGKSVFLAIADHEREAQSLLCFHRDSGQKQWEAIIHEGGFKSKGKPNKKSSLASSTPATDGERVFINFVNDSALTTTAVSLDGKVLWQRKISDYVIHQGYGASPAIYEDLVIVTADNKGGGAIAGLKRETGEVVWKRERPAKPNYSSPVIVRLFDKDQLILTGCDLVTSLDPQSGNQLWEIEGATTECVTSTVTDGTHVFTSGGYPTNHISAVKADGSGEIVWQNNTRAYVPSLLQKDGYLYAALDEGIAACFDCATGEQVWKNRLGGTFSSSPVLVGELIFATNEEGITHIFKATPEKFEKVGENKLGESVFATPVFVSGRVYHRAAIEADGKRQEYLYCIGN